MPQAMRYGWWLARVLLLLVIGGGSLPAGDGAVSGPIAAAPPSAAWIDPLVQATTRHGGATDFVVLLRDQADLHAAYPLADSAARGWYVYRTLRDHAARTQAGLRAFLAAQHAPYQAFWAANMLVVHGDRALVDALAARADVGMIEASGHLREVLVPSGVAPGAVTAPATVEWGVQSVNAPAVWALGYTGQGIVIGSLDSGVRWTHGALQAQYRGWNGTTADHNYQWWDAIHSGGGACGPNSGAPCDDLGHGSHTAGTAVGDDGAGNQIGVAPGARWMGCRALNQGTGTPASYSECFQFFLAPTDLSGQNPNPALRPDVVLAAWYCSPSEGCAANTLDIILANVQAAGIFVVASANSTGPGCGSMTDPPAIAPTAFTIGAIDANNALAGFSGRGPVTVDGSNRLKPDLVAPGIAVRSATNGGDSSYAIYQGTAMAAPHVAGAVALLWSAQPQLVRAITETRQILQNSANPEVIVSPPQTCGGIPSDQVPNHSFGYGRVDALAAVLAAGAATPSPTVSPTPAPVPPSSTATAAPATTTATPCLVAYNDVGPAHPFYAAIRCLACRVIVGGYPCGGPGEPCPGAYFRPNTNVTRGQTAKIISSSAALSDPVPITAQTFADVPPSSTFWLWVERLTGRGIIGGYPCGGPGEPCVAPANRPYFRPNNPVTRGQLAKITSGAAGWTETPTAQTFADSPPGSTFYLYVERIAGRSVVAGYPCGLPGEPCIPPGNRPYYRPHNNATRGQMSKIAASAFYPNCQTPTRR
jgi:subtilisin family serine protease